MSDIILKGDYIKFGLNASSTFGKRSKCEKWWQKLTCPLARWVKRKAPIY